MQSTERQEFEGHVGVLCAGFNVPVTAERIEAYWRGLMKMPLFAFARAVEFALGEGGPERLPTTGKLWEIYRQLRADQRERERPQQQTIIAPLSICHAYGNRALVWYLRKHGAVSEACLQDILREKQRLCDAYHAITSEEPEASLELRDKLFEAWDAVRSDVSVEEVAEAFVHFARTGRVDKPGAHA